MQDKVLQLLELKDNWDEEGAKAPTENTVWRAYYLAKNIECVKRQKIHAVVPGPNGEILIWLKKDDKDLEIIFYPDKKKTVVVRASNSEKASQDEFKIKDLKTYLKWLNNSRTFTEEKPDETWGLN